MSDELSGDELLNETAKRGEDGDLLPETKTITWKGEERQVRVMPVTIGRINELEQEYGGDFDRLDTEALRAIVFNQYVDPDLEAIYDDADKEWSDLKAARVEELVSAFEDLEEKADTSGNPGGMSRRDRAREMR